MDYMILKKCNHNMYCQTPQNEAPERRIEPATTRDYKSRAPQTELSRHDEIKITNKLCINFI